MAEASKKREKKIKKYILIGTLADGAKNVEHYDGDEDAFEAYAVSQAKGELPELFEVKKVELKLTAKRAK